MLLTGRFLYQVMLALLVSLGLAAPSFAAEADKQAKPEIVIDGIDGELADNVRSNLRLAAQACDAPIWRIRRLFETSDSDIEAALRPFGYYTPKIVKHYTRGKSCWSAQFTVDAGTRLRWTRVDVQVDGEAASDPAFRALIAANKLKVGEPVSHVDYEDLKSEILLLAAKRGYRDGRLSVHELRVDPRAGTAEALLHYASGPRYRFGEVRFQQDVFDPDFVKRYSQIHAGDYYDVSAIAQLQRDLMDSGLFTLADVKPELAATQDKRVALDVRLVPRKRQAYLAGIGVTTDEGPRLRLSYENRRLNRWGHTGEASLRLSSVRSNLDFSYNIPLTDPRTERLSLQAGYQSEHIDDTDSESYKASVRHIRRRADGWVQTLFVEALKERFSTGGERGDSMLLIPGISWDRRSADDPVSPQRGWRLAMELRGASKALLSDADFVRGHVSAKGILPFGSGRLLGRSELGYSLVGGFSDLPPSQRFFAGGDNSVRGYGYHELGPTDASGLVVGGRNIVTASIEYEHPIVDKWSAALFADTGNAFNGMDLNLHHAVGVGVRWRSPVGPVRLDLAHPLDKGADPFRIHFSLGPDL